MILSHLPSIQEEAIFTVTVTVDESPVEAVQITFNGNNYMTDVNGVATLVAPAVDQTTILSITASKLGYTNGASTITITDRAAQQQQLSIITPDIVVENQDFILTILAEESPVYGATIEFNDKIYSTDIEGTIILTAPDVDKDTTYPIQASKQEYLKAEKHIRIIDLSETGQSTDDGLIYGTITDSSDTPLDSATVCVKISDIIQRCVVSEQGQYSIPILSGTYTIEIYKQGYETKSIPDVIVIEQEGTALNATLSPIDAVPSTQADGSDQVLNVAIESAKAKKTVAGDIVVSDTKQISIYRRDVSGDFLTLEQNNVVFQYSGEGSGALLIFRIDQDYFSDPLSIQVTFDGALLELGNLDAILNGQVSEPTYGFLITQNSAGEQVVNCIVVASFSEHVIGITSIGEVIETVGGITAIMYYVVIAVVATLLFVGIGEISKRF